MKQIQPVQGTPKEIFRGIRVFFVALLSGTLIFTIITVALNFMEPIVSPVKEYENILIGASIAIGVISFVIANKWYNKGIAVAKDSLRPLPDKLNQYRATFIQYMALCEGPGLFGIILFFVTGNYLMFIITALMVVAMLSKRPTLKRVTEELGLGSQQQRELE